MDIQQRNEKFNAYVSARNPKTHAFPTLIRAFWVGGLICMIGQGFSDGISALFPQMPKTMVATYSLIIVIFLAALLTGIGIFDRIGAYAGAGTIVPITGFSNSITSPAMEFRSEGLIFGLCVKMFTIAGPVIVMGVIASAIVGIIYLLI
ncbi:MAG: SpoVA/SpoVAEb family sporulation membrane protein [Clostridia bacterium]|nr:SpoVA/SpoVAEb family sporulation membrane protein [Clostridia bacterium]